MNTLNVQQALSNILEWLKLSKDTQDQVNNTKRNTATTVSQQVLKVAEYVNSQPAPEKDPDFKPASPEYKTRDKWSENRRINEELIRSWSSDRFYS